MSPRPPQSQASIILSQLAVSTASTSELDPELAIPLLASLKEIQRIAALDTKAAITRTAEVRASLQVSSLDKTGLEYEKKRLAREIERCEAFDSIYQTVPLEGVDVETASHEEILAALDKELEDLQRLQATRTESKLERDRLQREVRAWKATLESSDVMLRDYAKTGKVIQTKVADSLRQC